MSYVTSILERSKYRTRGAHLRVQVSFNYFMLLKNVLIAHKECLREL